MLASILTFIFPMLLFFALEHSTVINITLISQLEGVFFIIFAILILRARVKSREIIGYAIILIAVVSILLITNQSEVRLGDIYAIAASFSVTLLDVLQKKIMENCSLLTMIVVSKFVSAWAFFSIALYLYGWHHFPILDMVKYGLSC